MSKVVGLGDAIEGLAIQGQSRKPLDIKNRGLVKYGGKLCYRFVARFDVRAHVHKPLPPDFATDERLNPEARTGEEELLAEKAIIHSIKPKYSSDVASGSHTHKTNHWRFPQQATVEVDVCHPELAQHG